jgi:hypothetical protein
VVTRLSFGVVFGSDPGFGWPRFVVAGSRLVGFSGDKAIMRS